MNNTEKKVYDYIVKNNMLQSNSVCIVGLSGGADSVCLLHILHRLSDALSIKLLAVHVNHKIRGTEAARDEEFSRRLCERLDIAFKSYSYDVPALADELGVGIEEAGRAARKEAFKRAAEENGAERLALAHHMNDMAETFLFHMARGSSVSGLSSLRAVSNEVIRPLLCLKKADITAYVKEEKLIYVEDSTNAHDDYTRNKIRHHIVTYLEEEINDKAVDHIGMLQEEIEEISEFLNRETNRAYETYVSERKEGFETGIEIGIGAKELDAVILKRLVRRGICIAGKRSKDITSAHILSAFALFDKQVGKEVVLPYSLLARRTYDGICIGTEAFFMNFAGADEKYIISYKIFQYCNEAIPQKKYTKWFDYDKIGNDAVFRKQLPGDYIIYRSDGAKKSLRRYMIDEKIPREKREDVRVLALESEVLWVIGYRIGERGKVDDQTKRVIEYSLSYHGEE